MRISGKYFINPFNSETTSVHCSTNFGGVFKLVYFSLCCQGEQCAYMPVFFKIISVQLLNLNIAVFNTYQQVDFAAMETKLKSEGKIY